MESGDSLQRKVTPEEVKSEDMKNLEGWSARVHLSRHAGKGRVAEDMSL
jgi:hypothetical protein